MKHRIVIRTVIIGAFALMLSRHPSFAQRLDNTVRVAGAMKNVMLKGQLFGVINLDTIAQKRHLYGLGPVEYLAGELLIVDGKSYKSTVSADSTIKVEETYAVKAPFFVYANVEVWSEHRLPDTIGNLRQLEGFFDKTTKKSKRPFAFKLSGVVESATIHVVNLPKGAQVSSPEDAHEGEVKKRLQNEASEILGFFSTEHKGVFTHHDTFLHLHLITADKTRMGHLDEATFKKGTMKYYVPKE